MYCVGSSHMLEWSGSHARCRPEQHAEKSSCSRPRWSYRPRDYAVEHTEMFEAYM